MNLHVLSARVRVEMDCYQGGSVLQGTVIGGCSEIRSDFELESDESEEKLHLLIRNTKRACFAENMVQAAVPLKSVVKLNGKPIDIPLED